MNRSNRTIGKRLWLTLLTISLALPMSAFADVVCDNENDLIPESTPTGDFVLHEDGTVTHSATGLTWMRCSLGQTWNGAGCDGDAETYTWQGALDAVVELNSVGFAGHTDWRLPNKNELASIVEGRCWNPAINTAVFPNTQAASWWSSSPLAGGTSAPPRAWRVDFDDGFVNWDDKVNNGGVRLVRAGQ